MCERPLTLYSLHLAGWLIHPLSMVNYEGELNLKLLREIKPDTS
jgi:hypothetical protein